MHCASYLSIRHIFHLRFWDYLCHCTKLWWRIPSYLWTPLAREWWTKWWWWCKWTEKCQREWTKLLILARFCHFNYAHKPYGHNLKGLVFNFDNLKPILTYSIYQFNNFDHILTLSRQVLTFLVYFWQFLDHLLTIFSLNPIFVSMIYEYFLLGMLSNR